MAGQWWRRLPRAERREYERSESIARLPLRPEPEFAALVGALANALERDDSAAAERLSAELVARICRQLRVPAVQVQVEGRRPHDQAGELHGLYRPAAGARRDHITVWMRTAKRREVVATRTFLRTLLHEVCHHLDAHLLDLPNSFHSPGFYQRESSLFRVIARGTPLAARARQTGSARVRVSASERRPKGLSASPAPDPDGRGIELLRAAAAAIAARSAERAR